MQATQNSHGNSVLRMISRSSSETQNRGATQHHTYLLLSISWLQESFKVRTSEFIERHFQSFYLSYVSFIPYTFEDEFSPLFFSKKFLFHCAILAMSFHVNDPNCYGYGRRDKKNRPS